MGKARRKRFSAESKAKVGLGVLGGEAALAALAARLPAPRTQIAP
jgi:hypothetical protein